MARRLRKALKVTAGGLGGNLWPGIFCGNERYRTLNPREDEVPRRTKSSVHSCHGHSSERGNLLWVQSSILPNKQLRAWLLLGWVSAERICPCKQPACLAIGCDSEVSPQGTS
ncbi:hypothetical protein J6590_004401 [Homalodisca vitripennis]|nr:hypothetical protein J6590_004401 [Homalodisca vitripennis]